MFIFLNKLKVAIYQFNIKNRLLSGMNTSKVCVRFEDKKLLLGLPVECPSYNLGFVIIFRLKTQNAVKFSSRMRNLLTLTHVRRFD